MLVGSSRLRRSALPSHPSWARLSGRAGLRIWTSSSARPGLVLNSVTTWVLIWIPLVARSQLVTNPKALCRNCHCGPTRDHNGNVGVLR